jgi:hypothetical protein
MTDLLNWAPYTILAGPADVYVADLGSAYPGVDDAPGGSWRYVGLTEGGVTVRHPQTITPISVDQYTFPVKAIRTEEGLEIEFAMAELTLENYSLALNSNPVDSSGVDERVVNFGRGVHVDLKSLLLKGRSPYGEGQAQYEAPIVYQSESPEVEHVKDDKSVLAVVWTALGDLSAESDDERFGRLVADDTTSS